MPSTGILSIPALNAALKPHKRVVLPVTLKQFTGARKRNVLIVKLKLSSWTGTSGPNIQNITRCMLATNAVTDPSISRFYKGI